MSPLSILLSDTPPPQPGQFLRGIVIVPPNIHRSRKGIRLRLRWHTQGKGFHNCGTAVELEPEWVPDNFEAGQYRYPFCLRLPYGPFSYTGEMFSVYWELEASPKTSWPLCPTARKHLALNPTVHMHRWDGPQHSPINALRIRTGLMSMQRSRRGTRKSLAQGQRLRYDDGHELFFCFGLLTLVVSLFLSMMFVTINWSLAALMCLPFLGLGVLAVCLPNLETLLASGLLRRIELDIPLQTQQGQQIQCGVRFTPRFGMLLQHIRFGLKAREFCRYMNHSRNYARGSTLVATHDFWAQTCHENQGMRLTAGKVVTSHACFQLPEDASLTFLAKDNQVVWQVTVTIQLKGLPSWSRSVMLEVQPSSVLGAQGIAPIS